MQYCYNLHSFYDISAKDKTCHKSRIEGEILDLRILHCLTALYSSQRRHNQREKMKRRDSFRITVMSVIVISIFLLTEIPLMVITLLHALSSSGIDLELLDYKIANYIVLIINTFMCLSCPLNLIVYCSMSKVFRKNFNSVISKLCCLVDLNLALIPVAQPIAQTEV